MASHPPEDRDRAARLLAPVREFVDVVLDAARDRFGPAPTPLFTDALDPRTREPMRLLARGVPVIPSNLANQLVFLRVLHGLSALTGDAAPRARALETCRFALGHARRRGMLLWGNHAAVDLLSGRHLFLGVKGKVHELKAHYPPWDLILQADPSAAEAAITYHWHGHMYDWAILDLSRHGRMDLPDYPLPADPWGAPYRGGPPFFIGGGLTFLNAGSDLYFAAASLAAFTGAPGPLLWARRLLERYIATRNPRTGMGGYQYSCVFDKADHTRSADRAWLQFAEQFPDHHPVEGSLSTPGAIRMIAGNSALCRLHLGRVLGPSAGTPFVGSAVEDLLAYAAWSYSPDEGAFHPTFTDGFRLTGIAIARDGYFGPAGRVFSARKADWPQFWAYAAGWRASSERLLWDTARSIGLHRGIGDIGPAPGCAPALRTSGAEPSAELVFALLDLEAALPGLGYLEAAASAAERLVALRFHGGLFVSSRDERHAWIGSHEPLAILHAAAHLAGEPEAVPPFCTDSALHPLDGWIRDDGTEPIASAR